MAWSDTQAADEDHFIKLGIRDTCGGLKPFGLFGVDRRQHVYVIGKSGTGKTTLLKNMIVQLCCHRDRLRTTRHIKRSVDVPRHEARNRELS